MSSRRRPPPDLASVKKSRSSYTGAVTKALDKLRAVDSTEPGEITLINTRDIDRILSSLGRTETGFLQTLEDAQGFIPVDGEEAFQLEEELAADTFQTNISEARDLSDQLLALKAVLNGLSDFNLGCTAIQDSLTEKPESNQATSLQAMRDLFSTLKAQWQGANLSRDHSLKGELDSCVKVLTTLGAEVAAAMEKSDSHSTISTSSSTSSTERIYYSTKSDLPTIDVPTFTGGIMEWSTFWASFKATIDDRKDLSSTQKLHYLRQAVKDPDIQLLLHSPTETPSMYEEVNKELKGRFNKTREIHREVIKSMLQLQTPKQTRVDLRRLTDTMKRHIDSLKAIEHYNVESFLTSFLYNILPNKLQLLWEQSI